MDEVWMKEVLGGSGGLVSGARCDPHPLELSRGEHLARSRRNQPVPFGERPFFSFCRNASMSCPSLATRRYTAPLFTTTTPLLSPHFYLTPQATTSAISRPVRQVPVSSPAMISAISKGPVSIAIDASSDDFQNYDSGIFFGE